MSQCTNVRLSKDRLGTKQALTSTKQLNTWTVAAHPQRTHKQRRTFGPTQYTRGVRSGTENNHHKTLMALAQPDENRLSTNPGKAQALRTPHSSTRSQEESSESIAHIQTAGSNTHSHQRHCVTATSRIHPLSAPNCCFNNAGIWTHSVSKDCALHIYISPAASVPSPSSFHGGKIRDAPLETEVLLAPHSSGTATPLLSSTSRSRLREKSSQVQRSTCTGVFNTTQDWHGALSHRLGEMNTTCTDNGTPRPCLESPETAEQQQVVVRTIRMRPSHWKHQQQSFSQAPCRTDSKNADTEHHHKEITREPSPQDQKFTETQDIHMGP